MAKKEGSRLRRVLVTAALMNFFMISSTALIGFSLTGFDSSSFIELYSQYGVFGLGSIIVALLFYFAEITINKGDEKYGDTIFLHSPGDPPSPKFFKFFEKRPFALILISFLLFSISGLIVFKGGSSFTGETFVEQQFSPGAESIFKFFLVPIAENMIPLSFVALFTFFFRRFSRKNNVSKSFYIFVLYIAIPLIFSIVWVGNHQLRYASSDLSILKVFGFGLTMGLLTVLTASSWPGIVLHATNNLFFDLIKVYGVGFTSRFIIILDILVIILLFFSLRGKVDEDS